MPVSEQRLLVVATALTSVALLVAGTTEHAELLAYAAPALVLALPLLSGRYLGEERLVRLASRPRGRRFLPRSVPPPAGYRVAHRAAPRGGLLIAASLAVRPPPMTSLR